MKNFLSIFALGIICMSGTTFAIELFSDSTVNIDTPMIETIFVGGNDVSIQADVDGDVFVGGQSVSIKGDISEDARIGGNTILIDGDIADDLRVGGNLVIIGGKISGDIMGAANSISINNNIDGDALLGADMVRISGDIGGKVEISANSLYVDSSIKGNLQYDGGELSFGSGAQIGGDLILPQDTKIDDVTVIPLVLGEIVRSDKTVGGAEKSLQREKDDQHEKGFHFDFMRFLSLVILGGLIMWLIPNYLKKSTHTIINQPVKTLGYGFLILIIIPVIATVLLMTGVASAVGGFLIANYIFLRLFLGLFAVVFGADLVTSRWLRAYVSDTLMTRLIVLVVLSALVTILPNIVSVLLGLFVLGAGYIHSIQSTSTGNLDI